MELLLALLSGATLGFMHSFDIDHIVAVSAFTGKTRQGWGAIRMGAMWGFGHTVVLLAIGGLLILFRLSIPQVVQFWSEVLVGIFLVGLGVWGIRDYIRNRHIHIHRHEHDGSAHIHFHSHEADPGHVHNHSHSLFALGALHGLAGSGSVVVMIPVALADSWVPGMAFLAIFGLGSIVSMSAFSVLLSTAVGRARSKRFITSARGIAGLASLTVGMFWIVERLI